MHAPLPSRPREHPRPGIAPPALTVRSTPTAVLAPPAAEHYPPQYTPGPYHHNADPAPDPVGSSHHSLQEQRDVRQTREGQRVEPDSRTLTCLWRTGVERGHGRRVGWEAAGGDRRRARAAAHAARAARVARVAAAGSPLAHRRHTLRHAAPHGRPRLRWEEQHSLTSSPEPLEHLRIEPDLRLVRHLPREPGALLRLVVVIAAHVVLAEDLEAEEVLHLIERRGHLDRHRAATPRRRVRDSIDALLAELEGQPRRLLGVAVDHRRDAHVRVDDAPHRLDGDLAGRGEAEVAHHAGHDDVGSRARALARVQEDALRVALVRVVGEHRRRLPLRQDNAAAAGDHGALGLGDLEAVDARLAVVAVREEARTLARLPEDVVDRVHWLQAVLAVFGLREDGDVGRARGALAVMPRDAAHGVLVGDGDHLTQRLLADVRVEATRADVTLAVLGLGDAKRSPSAWEEELKKLLPLRRRATALRSRRQHHLLEDVNELAQRQELLRRGRVRTQDQI